MRHSYQRGAVLVVSLLLLVVMTMLVLAAINAGTINLRIADNMRARQDAEAAAQLAINEVLSNVGNFVANNPPTSVTLDDGRVVSLNVSPTCVDARPRDGDTLTPCPTCPDETTWVFEADYENADGASATIHQGVQIQMLAGSCPGA